MDSGHESSGLMHGIMDWIHSIGLGAVIIWTVLLSFRVGGRNADLSQAQNDAHHAAAQSSENAGRLLVVEDRTERMERQLDTISADIKELLRRQGAGQ